MKEALLLWVALMVVSLASVFFVGNQASELLKNEIRNLAENTAESAVLLVNESDNRALISDGRMWSEEHKRLIAPLLEYHRRFPETARLRTVTLDGGKLLVVLDTETFAGELGMERPVEAIELRTPMEPRHPHEELAQNAIRDRQPATAESVEEGPFGTFITAAAPLGSRSAVLATVDVSERQAARTRMVDIVFVGAGISLIVATVIALGFFNIRTSLMTMKSSASEAQTGHEWLQARNRRLVEALGQLVLHRDIENKCLLWNGDPRGTLGLSVEEMPLSPESWEQRVHEEDRDGVRSALADACAGGRVYEIDFRVLSAGGDWVWLNERGVVTFDPEGAAPLAVDSVLLDITERKQADERLNALALIASRTDNAVCLTKLNGEIDWVNGAFEEMTGISREQALHRRFQDAVAVADKNDTDTVARMIAIAATNQSQVTELSIAHQSGRSYWAHLEIQPLADEAGDVNKLVIIQSDRTASKESETRLLRSRDAAEAADRAKSDFLAVMSHEVRTPLNAVLGFASLLSETSLNPQQRDYLATIQSSGENLLALVNDILDFSKMEADKFVLNKSFFDLRQCIESTLQLLGPTAARKGIELICDLPLDVPSMMFGDEARLRQVLLNLAGNAVKFTDSGDVVVSVKVVSRQGDTVRLRFQIQDSGPGITGEQQHALFKPFSQADSTATRKHGGTGLGLAISKRLVKLMGGEIGVTSEYGHGSVFWFELPTEASLVEGVDFAELAPLRGLSVIVVEKNTALRAVLTNQLTRWGMQVRAFARGRDAIYQVEQRRFDVAIIDILTPDIDGIRLAERIRRAPRGGVDRIILMRMPAGGDEVLEIHDAAVAYLQKPVRMSSLAALLLGRLDRSTPYPLDVPLPDAPAPNRGSVIAEAAQPQASASPSPGGPRILIADDNAINRKLVAKMLAKMGFDHAMAGNGLEALAAVENGQFDAVLMDLQMPEMDGLEATRQIRSKGFGVPIVAITADAMPDDQQRCREAGMNDYLSKPVKIADLEGVLNRLLGLSAGS